MIGIRYIYVLNLQPRAMIVAGVKPALPVVKTDTVFVIVTFNAYIAVMS